jgi:hypothetical protein
VLQYNAQIIETIANEWHAKGPEGQAKWVGDYLEYFMNETGASSTSEPPTNKHVLANVRKVKSILDQIEGVGYEAIRPLIWGLV